MSQTTFRTVVLATTFCLATLSTGLADDRAMSQAHQADAAPLGESAKQYAALAAFVPKSGVGTFARAFTCTGTIVHQSFEGALDSPLAFWLGIRDDNSIHGMITHVGDPLDFPSEKLAGHFEPKHDDEGQLLGGRAILAWPRADGDTVELDLVRETDIRVGRKGNGVANIGHQTTGHTYAARVIRFDTAGQPKPRTVDRVSLIRATCTPTGRLSLVTERG